MGRKKPRWADKPEFAWTPEPPLRFEPGASADFSAGTRSAPGAQDARPVAAPAPSLRNRTLNAPALVWRLSLGLAQGLILSALLYGRARHWWPDNDFVAGLILAMAFSPLLLVQGLGRVRMRTLLIWTATITLALVGLGVYQHWRAAGDTSLVAFWPTAAAAIFLFVGQSLLLAHADGGPLQYRALYESSWGLAIQLVLGSLCGACLWTIPLIFPVTEFAILPVMALATALVFQFADRVTFAEIEGAVTFVSTGVVLILISFSTFAALFWSLTRWLPPFALSAAAGLLMVVSINASYRNGDWRPGWRRRLEFSGAILLLPLAALCLMALWSRVASFGFTGPRVIALALALLLAAYALAYAGAALISLGGGRAMERLEIANLMMAFVVMAVMAAIASPLADPVRLAVAEQSWRLTHAAVAPGKFDYAYLRNSGLRFGHEALKHLAAPLPAGSP